ncbi:hypothetical protein [Aquicella lusitana]|jgi:FlgN protein.|uniref:FlgN protein n=1 Tax=Aquicella lusitana TaxID=254246 RepID=A0A370G849_9COXI|nr:hypothetical protein [Aquicella lusitana]RDI39972.1 hypothetical protein C8D86_12533 [Aquicella lusitana]VVC74575.1 hypothetical protein AQULUS_23410 [Aquicella lusitana]
MQTNTLLLSTLNEMLACCREIHHLLKDDNNHFKNDQFDLVDQSNAKKLELTEKIKRLVNQLDVKDQKYLMEKVAGNAPQSSGHDEIQIAVNQLNEEIMNCYKHIVVNSNIVFSNLQMIKEIGDKLIELKSGKQITYNEAGSIEKW